MHYLRIDRFIHYFISRSAIVAVAVACLSAVAAAQEAAPDPATAQRAAEELNRRPDNTGSGPFPAMKEELASLPDHVVYHPLDLDALGSQKLGVVLWGNGGCSFDGASARFHLLELASHGYLVIAGGRILSGPGAHAPQTPAEGQPAPRTTAAHQTEAIDWALMENMRAGSPWFGRIDPAQIAVSGHSCGGIDAIFAGADPRVAAVVLHNSGFWIEGPATIPRIYFDKDKLLQLHTPVLFILGGKPDIAYENGMDDFKRIEHVPVAVANLPVGHGGTFTEENGGSAATVAVNWLQWQLRGDPDAARYFVGANCALCADPEWTLERKHFEQAVN